MGEAMKRNLDLLDVVELRKARGGQPAGTVGAVVELFATEALIEIADENGVTAELLTVPYGELRVRPSAEPATRRAAG
jgi:hypothetical protein